MASSMTVTSGASDVGMNVVRYDGASSLSGDAASDIAVLVHPLVVINISDHFNRFAAMRFYPRGSASAILETPPPPTLHDHSGAIRVVGLLLGDQCGRKVDICHSFELPAQQRVDGTVNVDVEFMSARIEQYKQIFPHYHVVGWYSTGSVITEDDLRLHKELFSALNESPLLMIVNTQACMTSLAARLQGPSTESKLDRSGCLPSVSTQRTHLVGGGSRSGGECNVGAIAIYQAEMHMTDIGPRTLLASVPHRYASADSERIAVDHVTRHAVPGGGDGSATQHLGTLRQSVQMLSARIDVLLRFLDATANENMETDHALLRKVAGVCARMPAMGTDEFTDAFEKEQFDSTVVNYLCGVTKSLCAMNGLVDNFHFGYERSSSGGSRRRA